MPGTTRTRTKAQPSTGSAKAPAPQAVTAVVDAPTAPTPHDLSPGELDLLQHARTDRGGSDTDAAAGGPGTAPTMKPPQLGGAATAESAGVGISGQKVVALWGEQSNRNAYAYLQTAGWKRLSPLTDTGSTTMTLLAAHARATGSAPHAAVDSAGVIGTMYVW